MGIDSFSPQIGMLRIRIEDSWGKTPRVHNDFMQLAEAIKNSLRKHISETTLERVWGYSKRGYRTVSIHTLDLLCEYAGTGSWEEFCRSLSEAGIKDSDMFEGDSIYSDELAEGDRLLLRWLPNRECIIRHLGNGRFVAEECVNTTMQPGDTFNCIGFRLNQPAVMEKFIAVNDESPTPKQYVAGLNHGLSALKKL